MSYQLKVIKDYPIGFWPLDESSGATAADISGCGNNGTYTGGITNGLLPLVKGGQQGSLISDTKSISFPTTKDYSGSITGGSFGKEGFSDNDFTLEAWVYPKITTSAITPIFADDTNGIGIFWEAGTIVFRLQNEYLYYTPPYTKKAFHIAAIYKINSMSLYIDGVLEASKDLIGFKFTNTSVSLSAGPTTNSANRFIIDAPAVYRYALPAQTIFDHFINGRSSVPIQIVKPSNGSYFPLSQKPVRIFYRHEYPRTTSWLQFATPDLLFNEIENSLSMIRDSAGGSKTVTFTDYITVPTQLALTSSKVEWDGDNGITIETSVDGTSYQSCENGKAIPQYNTAGFDATGQLYIRITFTSTDISKHIPKIRNLSFVFYQDKNLPGYNTGAIIEPVNGEYHLGSDVYDILFRDHKNGLRCDSGSGFKINNSKSIRTLELFYTPQALTASGLISAASAATDYSWSNAGAISKTNISAIYINGADKTSETNISNVFVAEEIYHIIIVLTQPITGDITFNYTSNGATPSLYQNIGIYEYAFSQSQANLHYDLYTSVATEISDDSSMTLTETSSNAYDVDWVVIQSI